MMSSATHRSELVRLQKAAASLQNDIAKQTEISGKARKAAATKRDQASKAKSDSSVRSYLRQAEAEDKKVATAEKRIGELQGKLATNAENQTRKRSGLDRALKSEQNSEERKQKAARSAADRDDVRRRQKEKDHAREIGRLSSGTVRHILDRPIEPEKLRVLYLTASPEAESHLRVDAEVNNVMKALRAARHRELIELSHRPAATPQDLVDGINDLRPHVIHFSGHGGPGGLFFDNASLGAPEGHTVEFAPLARLMGATDFPPTLVVLNACETIEAAEVLIDSVPVVIAMSAPVGDMSAGLFATHFYAAIGAAQSIGNALEQARAMVAMALPNEPDLTTISTASDVDPFEIMLVKAL